MSLLNKEIIHDPDIKVIQETFSSPTVQKYLRFLAQNDAEELLSLSNLNMSDAELSKRHAIVSGKLAVYSTLLSITKE